MKNQMKLSDFAGQIMAKNGFIKASLGGFDKSVFKIGRAHV